MLSSPQRTGWRPRGMAICVHMHLATGSNPRVGVELHRARRTYASSQVATGLGPHDMGIGVHIHIAPLPTWLGSTPTTSPTTVNAQPRTLKSRQVSSSLVKSRQHTAGSTLNPASRPHGHQRHSHQRHGRLTVSSYCKSYCLFLRSCHASRKHAAAAETPKISSKSARGVG